MNRIIPACPAVLIAALLCGFALGLLVDSIKWRTPPTPQPLRQTARELAEQKAERGRAIYDSLD